MNLTKGIMESIKERKTINTSNKLGFSKSQTTVLVEPMNALLANYVVHYHKLRNYHWNVVGPDFFDLHNEFEVLYNEAKSNIDDIAEQIRVFGRTPLSTMADFLATSEIRETGTDLKYDEMVGEVLKDMRTLIDLMYHVLDNAIEIGDSGTEDMMKKFIKGLEKHHWMLNSFSIQA